MKDLGTIVGALGIILGVLVLNVMWIALIVWAFFHFVV